MSYQKKQGLLGENDSFHAWGRKTYKVSLKYIFIPDSKERVMENDSVIGVSTNRNRILFDLQGINETDWNSICFNP